MKNQELVRKNFVPWLALIRTEGLGLSLQQRAKLSGLSIRKVRTALEHPAYQEFRDARLQNRVSAFDGDMGRDVQVMSARLSELVPLAFEVYEHAMSVGMKDPRFIGSAVKAADSVLDRDKFFSRHSTQVHELRVPQADLERAREIARQLKAKPTPSLPPGDVIDAEIVSESPENHPTIGEKS